MFDALTDAPVVADVVLHEDGVFGDFLSARDGLLPDDEALLGAQWALVDRGVFEVRRSDSSPVDPAPGAGVSRPQRAAPA